MTIDAGVQIVHRLLLVRFPVDGCLQSRLHDLSGRVVLVQTTQVDSHALVQVLEEVGAAEHEHFGSVADLKSRERETFDVFCFLAGMAGSGGERFVSTY